MTENQIIPSSRRIHSCLAAALLLVSASGLCGCQMLAEKCDTASIPPNYSHDFIAPSCYGYFKTQWQPWPCDDGTESAGDRRRAKDSAEEIKPGDTDTLPPPSGETTTEEDSSNAMDLPNDLLPLPESKTPAFPPPDGETPEATPGDLLPPATPGTEPDGQLPPATPKTEGAMPPSEPESETPDAAEPLPDRLLPDDNTPPKTSAVPNNGNWDLESLPSDAPQGSLVSEGSQKPSMAPTQPMRSPSRIPAGSPTMAPERIENARRPSELRGASNEQRTAPPRAMPGAGASYQENTTTSKRAHVPADAFDDAPEAPAPRISSEPQQGPELRPQPTRGAANRQPTSIDEAVIPAGSVTAERATNDWRPSRSRSGSRSAVRNADGWQTETRAGEYPGRRTSFSAPPKPVEVRETVAPASDSGNPLR